VELQAFVSLARRRWWVAALALVVCLGASAALSSSKPKIYRASARLYVNVQGATGTKDQAEGFQLASQLLASYAKVVNSQMTTKPVAEALKNRITPAQVRAKVTATPVPLTLLIDVRATDQRPVFAAELANATATALAQVIDELGANPTGGVRASIIDRAGTPTSPSSPRPKRDLAVGGFLGLALGAAAALAIDALDRTIREPSEAAEVFDAPVLCSVPKQRQISADPLVALKRGGSPTGEAYRALRTAIRFRESSHRLKTVLVTSAAAGDGKSTIAANLAIAMSLDGAKVILIDADLRRTRLSGMFKLPTGPGLTDVLLDKVKLPDALAAWSAGLSILQVGSYTLNPSEALGSPQMVQVLENAKKLADIVIVDAPPVLPVADPSVLAALVDGTVLVCRWGRTSLHAAESTRAVLENVGADVIGVVLNAEGGGRSASYYRHYSTRPQHRRDGAQPEAAPAASGNGSRDASSEIPATSVPPPDAG
jgi:succinoglycan biosynthesis transport protein ExoP